MRCKLSWVGVILVGIVLLSAVAASADTGLFWGTARYKVGEAVVFKITTESTCWWCCSSCGQPACPDVTVSGWQVADSSGKVVYKVVFDAPVPVATWQGTWSQLDGTQKAVAVGYYSLGVDTSVGALSLCFRIYDPCGCGSCGWWSCCNCEEHPSITSCTCKTTLVFVPPESSCGCGQGLFGWLFGLGCGCGCGCSGNCPCQQNP